MLVAVAAMAFIACSQEGNEVNVLSKGGTTYEFTAEINEETRSSFGEKVDGAYPSFWSGYESVSFYATDNYGYVDSMTISDDKKLASFTVVFETELNAGDIIYAYSGESWTGDEAANKTVSIENSQQSTETSVNDRNHYLFAEYTVGEEGVTAPISLSFKHGAAYGKMQLTQFNGSEISEVKITIDENTYTVEPQYLENPTIWFACYEDTNIETFSIEAKVNGIKYGKTIDMASKANPLTFTTGTVSSFKVEGLEELPADYEVTLSSYTINTENYDRKVWIFSNEAGDYLSIPFNPNLPDELPAGNYTGVDMCYMFSDEYALEYSKYDTSYNLTAEPYDYARWANEVAVNISRDEHNMLDFTAYVTGSVDGYTKTTKFSYKEVYTEIVEFDGTIKSWTHTETNWPTYYQIAGDNFSFEIGFYRNHENYIDYRDGGYSLGDAGTSMRYFAIRNLVIDGNSLTVSAGTVITNTAGGAGELHDIDITLTANGNDYDFSYYGYINGVAVDNSGSEGGEEPEESTTVNVSLNSIEHYNYNVSYYYHEFQFSDDSNANVLRAAFDITYCSDASINAGTYTHKGLNSLYPGTNYNITYLRIDDQAISEFNAGDMTITVDGNNYTISVQITSGTNTYNVSLNGTLGESEPIVTTPLTTPSNLKVTYNGTSATITWDAVEGVNYYGVTYGSTAKNTLTNSVTLEGLSYNTDYTVNVVAHPSDTTLHTSSEAASITINIGEDPNAGGGDEPDNRFEFISYGTDDVEVRFYFNDGNDDFIYLDFLGDPLVSKTYTTNDFNFNSGYSGIYKDSLHGSVTSANVTVTVDGNTYTFVGTVETDLGNFDINISGTPAIEE